MFDAHLYLVNVNSKYRFKNCLKKKESPNAFKLSLVKGDLRRKVECCTSINGKKYTLGVKLFSYAHFNFNENNS